MAKLGHGACDKHPDPKVIGALLLLLSISLQLGVGSTCLPYRGKCKYHPGSHRCSLHYDWMKDTGALGASSDVERR